jgi:predicted SprT family Zn-dependent metalloprotease
MSKFSYICPSCKTKQLRLSPNSSENIEGWGFHTVCRKCQHGITLDRSMIKIEKE